MRESSEVKVDIWNKANGAKHNVIATHGYKLTYIFSELVNNQPIQCIKNEDEYEIPTKHENEIFRMDLWPNDFMS